MNIDFLTLEDPRDKKTFSGIFYQMMNALTDQGATVRVVGPAPSYSYPRIVEGLLLKVHALFGKRYLMMNSVLRARFLGGVFSERLIDSKADVVLALGASITSFLRTDLPVAYWSDGTFDLMRKLYPIYKNLSWLSSWEGELVERVAVKRADLLMVPGNWAAESFHQHYRKDSSRIAILPWGCSLEKVPNLHELRFSLKDKICHLLFLGVEWDRKGGATALEALRSLKAMGVAARLTICGCQPPETVHDLEVECIRFLDKNIPEQAAQLDALWKSVDFLVLPTKADCYSIAVIEAMAYGVPILTTAVGGMHEMVSPENNGYLLDVKAPGSSYADLVARVVASPPLYQRLSQGSRQRYEETFNWQIWGRKAAARLETLAGAG